MNEISRINLKNYFVQQNHYHVDYRDTMCLPEVKHT